MNFVQDPIAWRGVERIIIAFAGALFGVLGYRLFALGLQRGKGHLDAHSKFFRIMFSGTGPGLFFMLAGAIMLLVAVFKGGAESRSTSSGEVMRLNASAPRSPDETADEAAPQVLSLDPAHPAYRLQRIALQGKADRLLCESSGGTVVPFEAVDLGGNPLDATAEDTNQFRYSALGNVSTRIIWGHDIESETDFVAGLFSESSSVAAGVLVPGGDLKFCLWHIGKHTG